MPSLPDKHFQMRGSVAPGHCVQVAPEAVEARKRNEMKCYQATGTPSLSRPGSELIAVGLDYAASDKIQSLYEITYVLHTAACLINPTVEKTTHTFLEVGKVSLFCASLSSRLLTLPQRSCWPSSISERLDLTAESISSRVHSQVISYIPRG